MDTPSVAVVICAHTMDRLGDIGDAVASVARQTTPPDEVILVIDYNDELLAAVTESAFGAEAFTSSPDGRAVVAKVVANDGPKGLSGARNTGTELAGTDIVAYLDDDATADADWLATLCAPFADPTVVAVGGRAIPQWDTGAPDWFPAEYLWVVGCSHEGLPEELAEVRNVIGCNMAFRRRAVIDLGGFDVGLGRTANRPLGCEETELCIRMRQADDDARILLEPKARIHHRVPEQRTTWKYFFDRCRAEGNSKAYVVGLVGSDDGLASERGYVTSVLPRAALRATAGMVTRPVTSVKTLVALVGGLLATAGGYGEMKLKSGFVRAKT